MSKIKNGLHTQINYSNETQSFCESFPPPLQQKCPSVNILYKNELLQIDQVEHDNDLSQKPFLSYSSILDRRKQFYRRF